MAYAQYAVFTVKAKEFTATLKNFVHEWGKFYDGVDKGNEIEPSALNGTTIAKDSSYTFGACGRDGAASGTTGSFDIYDNDRLLASYHWDCPWGSKTNTSNLAMHVDNYVVQVIGANTDSGALGSITITAVKI